MALTIQKQDEIRGARILARRWFDKKNGNTYHSVRVIMIDGSERCVSFEYGYGDAYLQTAAQQLGIDTRDLFYSMRQALNIGVDCVDVCRRV